MIIRNDNPPVFLPEASSRCVSGYSCPRAKGIGNPNL